MSASVHFPGDASACVKNVLLPESSWSDEEVSNLLLPFWLLGSLVFSSGGGGGGDDGGGGDRWSLEGGG